MGVDTIAGLEPEQAGCAAYYIPTELWEQNETALRSYIDDSEGASLVSVEACEDRNWNEVWEAEHPVQELPLGVKIVPHCAFGAGHHETTSMMIEALLQTELTGQKVLDNGCGTGVLGIFATKRGAKSVIAIDIDDKSVQNTLENAALNGMEIDARLGDLSSLPFGKGLEEGSFDLILANIHRNILLAQMPLYARVLKKGGEVWMSGFYETDIPALQEAAEKEGLTLIEVRENGEWRWMRCRREERI